MIFSTAVVDIVSPKPSLIYYVVNVQFISYTLPHIYKDIEVLN